ncbi:hypothetical protein [Clostridium sp.]|jgi:hypothetical protein|uniref:hypothetical protein n=1 Tax=Clostridium sp. TaxID=1506 RepID=UPI003EEE1AB1
MLKNKFYRTLLVAGITGNLIISTGVVAFASTTTPKTKISSNSIGEHQRAGNDFMQKGDIQKFNPLVSVLKTQVTAGTITQAESDAITSFLTTKEAADRAEMVAQKETKDAMTSDEKTAAITALKATKDAEKAKLNAMTVTERQAYMKVNKPVKDNIITELVTANLLTQDQATKIQATIPQKNKGGKYKGEQGNPLVSVLKTQVTAGTITQAEADQATAVLKTKEDTKKAEMIAQKATKDAMTSAEKTAAITALKTTKDAEKTKLNAMTVTERQAYMEANKPAKENIFTNLVTDGILTQDQADKIQASMPQRPKMDNSKGQKSQVAPTITSTNE